MVCTIYANMVFKYSEEVTYYIARFEDYSVPFMTALAFNFLVPITMLMSRDSKVTGRVLIIGSIVLVGHYLDFFVMIMPGTVFSHWHLGLLKLEHYLVLQDYLG